MNAKVCILGCAAMLLSACEDFQGASGAPGEGFIRELPEEVLAIAATNQDLSAVRINPADGCYVYQYVGPVETTFLPLRTTGGSPICTRTDEAPVAG